jgi:hypothetical protein
VQSLNHAAASPAPHLLARLVGLVGLARVAGVTLARPVEPTWPVLLSVAEQRDEVVVESAACN